MDELQQRNAEIARALDDGEKATELAARYQLSRSHIHRIGKAYRSTQQAEKFQAGVGNGRSNVGGSKFTEIGTTGLRRHGGDIDEDYDRVFRPLNKKLALFKEMADDPVVAAVLQAIRMTLRRVSWYVDPIEKTDANKRAAEWLEGAKDDMSQSFSDTIDQVLNMMRDGFQPFEIVYKKRAGDRPEADSKYNDGKIGWRKWIMLGTDSLAPGEPWTFDEHGGLQTINQMAAPDYKLVHIPIEKAILFRTTTDKANPEGRAILRAMYPAWYMKKNLEEIEAISAERIGAGFPVAYLGSDVGKDLNSPNSDAALIQDALRNIRVDEQMGLLIPYAKMGAGAREGEGVLFEFVSPPGTKAVEFNAVIARYEQRIAMVGLAQFIHLGMNQVGARALGDSAQDFFTTALSGWADSIEDTINRYGAERLFRLNSFPGVKRFPRLRHDTVGQYTLSQLADYISKLAGVNILVPDAEIEKYLRTFANLPEKPIEVKPPVPPAALNPPPPPPGQQPPQQLPEGEPNPDADAQPPEQAAETFADKRGGGPGRRSKPVQAVNAYQAELERIYSDWSDDLSAELSEADEDERDAVVAAALAALLAQLRAEGRSRITAAAQLAWGKTPPSPVMLGDLQKSVSDNDRYLSDSLIPALQRRISDGLADADTLAALETGDGKKSLLGWLMTMGGRVAGYAGAAWALNAMITGRLAQEEDKRIYWRRDPLAKHCEDCLEFGDREYASMDDLLAETGGITPANGTACQGNCRCSLEILDE